VVVVRTCVEGQSIRARLVSGDNSDPKHFLEMDGPTMVAGSDTYECPIDE
jgi:hypothetical protein